MAAGDGNGSWDAVSREEEGNGVAGNGGDGSLVPPGMNLGSASAKAAASASFAAQSGLVITAPPASAAVLRNLRRDRARCQK
jgi:hypothetical protein